MLAGIAAGAETDLMDDAWWGPTIPLPNGPWFCLAERNLPGSIIVNQAGERFMNEALPYVEAVHEIYKGEATGVGHVPAWMVIDQRYRNRYLFAGLIAAPAVPGPLVQERHRQEGGHARGARRRDRGAGRRARRRPSSGSTASPASGVDEDFHRGESAYDKYYSDPTVKPNPSLHAIDQGAVLRRQDRARRPRHQGRPGHRRAGPGAARRTAR